MINRTEIGRLPKHFHASFKPERQYINSMLRFAASGQSGDTQTIAAATGIPMGTSSGKTPAILDYCKGMGLIRLTSESARISIKSPELTSFGRTVLLEDPFLKYSITQWLAHFNMCSPFNGADIWYQTFFVSAHSLGKTFSRDQLDSELKRISSANKGGLIGPLIGMYEDDAAFKRCGVLSESEGLITRKPAPITDEFVRGYGAWLLQMIFDHYPTQQQISLAALDEHAGVKTIPGWSGSLFHTILELLERKSYVSVDRHMTPWLIQPIKSVDDAWRNIFADIA